MSQLEDHLVQQIAWAKLPAPQREFRFAPPRRWRFDLAWLDRLLALEVDGGTWVRGRHSRGIGTRKDAEKLNEAQLAGWTVLRATTDMVTDGSALALIERALKAF